MQLDEQLLLGHVVPAKSGGGVKSGPVGMLARSIGAGMAASMVGSVTAMSLPSGAELSPRTRKLQPATSPAEGAMPRYHLIIATRIVSERCAAQVGASACRCCYSYATTSDNSPRDYCIAICDDRGAQLSAR